MSGSKCRRCTIAGTAIANSPKWNSGATTILNYPPAEQRRIGEKIARQFAGWLGPLGITPATIPAIEAEYLGLLADLEQHFAQHDFLFGAAPSLVDCAMFGPLQAHLFRDPNSGRVMRRHAPQAIAWLVRMHTPVLARALGPTHSQPRCAPSCHG